MKSFHALIRQVHLLAGLVLAVAIVFYTVSGAAIVYARWLPEGQEPRVETQRVPLSASATASPGALRNFLETELGVRGRASGPERQEGGGVRLRYHSPGTTVQATMSPDRTELVVVTTQFGVIRTLRTLHTLTGYAGGWAFVAWSLFLDLVALATIGFALSGIYLWYKLTRRRRLGWLVLAGSGCYTAGVILYLWLG